jgi:hypothetical protein
MMKIPNPASGLLWVENRIRELSGELGRPVDYMEWPRPGDPTIARSFKANTIPLRTWRGGELRILEFRQKELMELFGDPELQRWLGERMRPVLLRLQPRA